ncbi:Oidioi.mRNA.OKI2018_I69.XSR.g13571.t1.cds [Oikopleura dioica]|uniref:Oidioi.mRNA.OKI2018_I69.XSR.g13571.t1.cds n=1 Tax=Oikopleura dioica TaxID=34765 RepID=A0ABN7SB45_OIKDI|nr:Oidioi.mRNA.OKI2018_I69.XSR.g13571.t1.cds [Oikopleura dioica]
MKLFSYGGLVMGALGSIVMDKDESSFVIERNEPEYPDYMDAFDDDQVWMYQVNDTSLTTKFLDDFPVLKSSEPKPTFVDGGIRVRNMGRIMKMTMFMLQKPPNKFISIFKKYGCHCWPRGRTILGGQGRPKDEVDRTCKRLYNCHKCNFINSSGSCSPDATQYKVRGYESAPGVRVLSCGDAEGSCERNLCECDLAFALDMAEKVQPDTLDEVAESDNAKSNGFRADESCQVQGNSFSKGFQRAHHTFSEDYQLAKEVNVHNGFACCGDSFENYSPYRPEMGQRCCNKMNVYSLGKNQVCCRDGTIAENGECLS